MTLEVPYRRSALLAAATCVALATLTPSPARGTVISALDLDQMVGRADRIFAGKVIELKSRWTTGPRRRIVTDITVEVDRAIRGVKKGERVTVRRMGGTVDGIGMKVFGAAVMSKGETVMLFTERRGSHRFVVGMQQGLFRLYRATDTKTLMVRRRLTGLSLIKREAKTTAHEGVAQRAPIANVQRLDTFIDQVRRTIASCESRADRCRITRR